MREAVRIVSFLPAATEIVHALGGAADLVGRSHECDYPAEVATLPVVSRPVLRLDGMRPEEVDRAVAERLKRGESLYEVDEVLLRDLSPDVILTQDLCQVCAPSGNELSRALRELPGEPRVLRLTPRTIAQIYENILEVGAAIRRRAAAEALVAQNRERIARLGQALAGARVRRVAFLEWIEPIFCGGHWVPEMIALAGGKDPLGKPGADSERVNWEDVLEMSPEIVIVAPCGYGLQRATELGGDLPSISNATVYAVDANGYFARPGPRVAAGVKLLAHLFHPERFPWPHAGRPWAEIG